MGAPRQSCCVRLFLHLECGRGTTAVDPEVSVNMTVYVPHSMSFGI
jgi:hypothetical protein